MSGIRNEDLRFLARIMDLLNETDENGYPIQPHGTQIKIQVRHAAGHGFKTAAELRAERNPYGKSPTRFTLKGPS